MFSLHKICPFFPKQHWHSLTCLTASPTFHFSGGLPSIWLQPEYKISSRSATEENLGWSFFSGSQKCSISAIVNSLTKRKQAHRSQTLLHYGCKIIPAGLTSLLRLQWDFLCEKKEEKKKKRETVRKRKKRRYAWMPDSSFLHLKCFSLAFAGTYNTDLQH